MKTNTKHWASITAGILSLAGYASAASLGSEKYTYDASGNITEKSIDGKVTIMSFDQSNSLIEKKVPGQSKETISYDAAGRPTVENAANGQQLRSMSYGYGDKVLETKNQGRKSYFYYNAEGQLIGKSNNEMVSTYSWDGNVMAAEGAETFINEDHITGGIPVLSRGGEVVVSDYLGNTLTTGEKVLVSSAYGEGLEDVRFTGKPFIKELASFVFPHRLYSPELSQWYTTDPSGYPDGINNRIYVSGDPVRAVDPTGLAQSSVSCEVLPLGVGTSVGSVEVFYTYDKDNAPKYKSAGYSVAVYGASMSNPTGKITGTGTVTSTGDPENKWFYYNDVKATGQVTYKSSYNANPVSAYNRKDAQGNMIDAIGDSGSFEK